MDVIEAVKQRKSVRGYKPDPVPRQVLEQILEVASRAPSAMNTQPWEFNVLTGEVLENVKRNNVDLLNSGVPPNPEHVVTSWPKESIYRQRQVDLAKQLFQLIGSILQQAVVTVGGYCPAQTAVAEPGEQSGFIRDGTPAGGQGCFYLGRGKWG